MPRGLGLRYDADWVPLRLRHGFRDDALTLAIGGREAGDEQMSLSRLMVYCAIYERRHYGWPVSSSATCRLAPPSFWI